MTLTTRTIRQRKLSRGSRRVISKTVESNSDNPKKRVKHEQQSTNQTESYVLERNPVHSALCNPLILLMIMKMLKSTTDLLGCRLVAQSWNELSSKILLKRKDIQVSFIFYTPNKNITRSNNNSNNENHGNDEDENNNNQNEEIAPPPTTFDNNNANSSNPSGSFILNRVNIRTLDEFNNVLLQSKGFPCVNFKFKGNLKHPDAQKFLTIFGSKIKRLHLINATNLVHFRKLLFNQAKNIEHLTLHSWGKKSFSSLCQAAKKQIQLVSLKCFQFYDQNKNNLPLALAFLDKTMTPNLQYVGIHLVEDDVDFFGSAVLSDRLSLFKKPAFNIRNIEELNIFENFVNSQNHKDNNNKNNISHNIEIQLKNIGLCASYLNSEENLIKLAEIFSNLLLHNQKNLKSICLDPPVLYSWTGVKWPESMETLNDLCLHLGALEIDQNEFNNNVPTIKQSPFILSSSRFPNLHKVTLKGGLFRECFETNSEDYEFYSYLLSTYFPFEFRDKNNKITSSTLDTVEHFQLYGNCSLEWMKTFTCIFPNVQYLSLFEVSNFPSFGSGIFKFSKMQHLKLNLELSQGNYSSGIDSTITGLDQVTCVFLNSSGKDLLKLSQIEKLRKHPSILDVKELKQVDLIISIDGVNVQEYYDDSDEEGENYFNGNIISPVSAKYGFSLLPALEKVCISVEPYDDIVLPGNELYMNRLNKIYEVLNAMSPYAQVIPPK